MSVNLDYYRWRNDDGVKRILDWIGDIWMICGWCHPFRYHPQIIHISSKYHPHIQISSTYHPHFIHISSRYYPDITHISSKYQPHIISDIIHISSRYHPHIIHISSRYQPHIIRLSPRYRPNITRSIFFTTPQHGKKWVLTLIWHDYCQWKLHF